MSCSVAVSNSPVFSPSRISLSSSLFCNENLAAISSPLRIRLHKSPSGLGTCTDNSSISTSNSTSTFTSSSSSSSSPTLLKRKRPARLDIPVVSAVNDFGAPATPCATQVEVERDGYSVYCKKGRREAMEDRYSASVDLLGDPKLAFFGIYDGHGGAKAAEFAAQNLHKNIVDEVVRRGDEEIEEAIKHGYLKTDDDFLKEDLHGGSCCVTALVRKGSLFVSNAGDCRAVLSRGGVAEALTSDHRPSREDEKDRIESLGGYVDCCRGVWRIQGSLAVSRGIGDGHLKQWVTAVPETKVLPVDPTYEFLILASDGLWDKVAYPEQIFLVLVSNQEAIDIARPLCVGVDEPEPLRACKTLVNLSAARGSADDISVMLIQLGRYI
ncbi:PPM-type phosphatase-like domain [Dillenia turbinata]|uniref:protein-serine/threonine phosphatase n=1 Tax=Dillenia turbinata TaxID=194707 RepID=A0AAN8VTV9_9MAGN